MKEGLFSIKEEIANAITHGIGAALAIAALVVLIVAASLCGTVWHIVGFSIYGAAMVILYFASTLYHSLTHLNAKSLFRKFDHMSIFLLIAGTYTPFCLTALPGWIGWTIFGITWACAVSGIVLKAFHTGKYERLSTFLYVVMGWLILPAIKPLYTAVNAQTFIFLMIGGVFYTAGTYFFLKDTIKPFYHSIWHLFVLAGSISHFFSVFYLLP
ncbi:PAQR family membrane homeostasis protein TrhA [Chryseosolibacter indicus]|uniref:Hemolysin III family protein n=1 Tax=Chryseosolibacter indicus TaxID=2782351 RepID=A0ABS5VPL8_9BACT|nr:hemolysin III family protein [Chryseosolibacter indicus]MBT1703377.1 hemolysin III family protein [Chryseosolibacter indicus]